MSYRDDVLLTRCRQRLLHLGYTEAHYSVYHGSFLANIVLIHPRSPRHARWLVYKEPHDPVLLDVTERFPSSLHPFFPGVVARFVDPLAYVMEHAGVPHRCTFQIHPVTSRLSTWRRIIDVLAQFHVRALYEQDKLDAYIPLYTPTPWTLPDLTKWSIHRNRYDQVQQMIHARSYEWHAGITTITHGDPHPGNVLTDGNTIVLIDWDWCRRASPMRDMAGLLQAEPDVAMRTQGMLYAIDALHRLGFPCPREQLLHDGRFMMIDQAVSWMDWIVRWHASDRIATNEARERIHHYVAVIEQEMQAPDAVIRSIH